MGTEPIPRRGDRGVAGRDRLLHRQRAVRRAEPQREGQRPMAGAQPVVVGVDVEQPDRLEQRPCASRSVGCTSAAGTSGPTTSATSSSTGG